MDGVEMVIKSAVKSADDFQFQAEQAAALGDWQTAAQLYARSTEQRAAMLALINKVQEGLSSQLEIQNIYTLVGDSLLETFNAQVVMISEYNPVTNRIFHQYGIERGVRLSLSDWMPLNSSWAEIVRTRKPLMINQRDLLKLVETGKMGIVPGTETPKTWLGVPIMVGNAVHGVVCLQNLELENAFNQADVDLLTTLTNSLALSLENARLFDRTERMLRHLRAEMDIARQTQRSILPAHNPHRAGYQFGTLILPSRAVGGDFYDFIPLDEDKLGIVMGDVSDKGLPAALFMALTFSLLRAESERSHDPVEVLNHVNRTLLKMNASGMFVTLLYAVLDYRTGVMQYSRAGHLLPIILDGRGEPITLPMGVGQPLGLYAKVALDEQEVAIMPGGMILFFTDGLNEAVDESGEQFGLERVVRLLQASREESAKGICRRLWAAVKDYSRAAPNQDDFAVLLMKRAPSGAKSVDLTRPIYW